MEIISRPSPYAGSGRFTIRIRMWASPDDEIAFYIFARKFQAALSYDLCPMKLNYVIITGLTQISDYRVYYIAISAILCLLLHSFDISL